MRYTLTFARVHIVAVKVPRNLYYNSEVCVCLSVCVDFI